MPDFTVDDMSIDAYDYVSACGPEEIRELIQELKDNGYLSPGVSGTLDEWINPEWLDIINLLHSNKHRLSVEDENIIRSIANKL